MYKQSKSILPSLPPRTENVPSQAALNLFTLCVVANASTVITVISLFRGICVFLCLLMIESENKRILLPQQLRSTKIGIIFCSIVLSESAFWMFEFSQQTHK